MVSQLMVVSNVKVNPRIVIKASVIVKKKEDGFLYFII